MTRFPAPRRVAILLIICASTSLHCTAISGQEDLKRRVLEEGPKAWSRLEHLYSSIHGEATDNGEAIKGLPDSERWSVLHQFWLESGSIKHIKSAVLDGRIRDETASVINPQYSFRLSRDRATDPWLLVKLDSREPVEARIRQVGTPLFIPTMVDMQSLAWTFSQGGFQLTGAKPKPGVNIDSQFQLIEVSFTSTARFRPDYLLAGAKVVLDANHSWVICEYVADIQVGIPSEPGKVIGHVEYSYDDTGMPLPLHALADTVFDSSGIHRRRTIDYRVFEKRQTPSLDFTLTAFGLPEPARPFNTRIWLVTATLAIAVLCFLASFFFRRRAADKSVAHTSAV